MSKPRPVVVVQRDLPDPSKSVTICRLTRLYDEPTFTRVIVIPSEQNGIEEPSKIMVDKIQTVHRNRLRTQIGMLGPSETRRLNQSLRLFLDL